jgi:hypothetical protein
MQEDKKITFNRPNLVFMSWDEVIDKIKEHFPGASLIYSNGNDFTFLCGCFVILLDQMGSGEFSCTVAAGSIKSNHSLERFSKSMPLENALLEVKEFLVKQQQAIAKTLGEK